MPGARRLFPFLLLLLLSLALTFPALLGGEAYYFRDLFSHHAPHLELGARLWMSDGVPLWSALFSCGEPHLANPQKLAMHPVQLLYFVLPPHRAVAASLFLLFFLSCAGMAACARGLGASTHGALVAGIAFELSGFILSLGNLVNLLASAAPLPLMFLFAIRAAAPRRSGAACSFFLSRASWRDLAAASALFALQLLGGDPFVAALSLASLAIALPIVAAGSRLQRLASTAWVLAGITLLAALIDAAMILPAAAFLPDTVRAWGFRPQWALQQSLHPIHLAEVLVPGVFGDPLSPAREAFWGMEWFDTGRPFILALGLGKVALLAAGAAWWEAARRRRSMAGAGSLPEREGCAAAPPVAGGPARGRSLEWPERGQARIPRPALVQALGWMALVFLVLALGRYGVFRLEWLGGLNSIPLLRYPVRFFLVPTFALCLVAAFGIDGLINGARRRGWAYLALGTAGALTASSLVTAALAAGGVLSASAGHGIAAAFARSAAACAALGLVLALADRKRWGCRERALALVAIAAVEPLLAYGGLNPSAPRELLTRLPEAVSFLQSDPDRFRIWRDNSPPLDDLPEMGAAFLARTLWFRDTLHPSYGLPFDLAYALNRTGDETDTQRTAELGRALVGESLQTRARVLGIAGVKYLLGFSPPPGGALEPAARFALPGPDLHVWRNQFWLPTARWVPGARRASARRQALELLLDAERDPRAEVLIEAPGEKAWPAPSGVCSAAEPADACTGSTEIVVERPTYLKIRTEARREGYLVLADQLLPGWRAWLDGSPVQILRAEYLFRAVRLPPGVHVVEFAYRPAAARAGAWMSLAGILAVGALLWLGRLKAADSLATGGGQVIR